MSSIPPLFHQSPYRNQNNGNNHGTAAGRYTTPPRPALTTNGAAAAARRSYLNMSSPSRNNDASFTSNTGRTSALFDALINGALAHPLHHNSQQRFGSAGNRRGGTPQRPGGGGGSRAASPAIEARRATPTTHELASINILRQSLLETTQALEEIRRKNHELLLRNEHLAYEMAAVKEENSIMLTRHAAELSESRAAVDRANERLRLISQREEEARAEAAHWRRRAIDNGVASISHNNNNRDAPTPRIDSAYSPILSSAGALPPAPVQTTRPTTTTTAAGRSSSSSSPTPGADRIQAEVRQEAERELRQNQQQQQQQQQNAASASASSSRRSSTTTRESSRSGTAQQKRQDNNNGDNDDVALASAAATIGSVATPTTTGPQIAAAPSSRPAAPVFGAGAAGRTKPDSTAPPAPKNYRTAADSSPSIQAPNVSPPRRSSSNAPPQQPHSIGDSPTRLSSSSRRYIEDNVIASSPTRLGFNYMLQLQQQQQNAGPRAGSTGLAASPRRSPGRTYLPHHNPASPHALSGVDSSWAQEAVDLEQQMEQTKLRLRSLLNKY